MTVKEHQKPSNKRKTAASLELQTFAIRLCKQLTKGASITHQQIFGQAEVPPGCAARYVAYRSTLVDVLRAHRVPWRTIADIFQRDHGALHTTSELNRAKVRAGHELNVDVNNEIAALYEKLVEKINYKLVDLGREVVPGVVVLRQARQKIVPGANSEIIDYRKTRLKPPTKMEQAGMISYIRTRLKKAVLDQDRKFVREDIAWHSHVIAIAPRLWYRDITAKMTSEIRAKNTTRRSIQ